MGFLEKLWDDTVAGPQPDSGLGRLRKLSPRSTPSKVDGISSPDNQEEVKVSRKIMIVKPPGYNYQGAGSAPASPAILRRRHRRFPEADQEHSGFGGDPRQMRLRRQKVKREPSETLLLLKMSDI
ncbi:Dormancy-associated protein-like protein 3 [Bienertia sinuspersici]